MSDTVPPKMRGSECTSQLKMYANIQSVTPLSHFYSMFGSQSAPPKLGEIKRIIKNLCVFKLFGLEPKTIDVAISIWKGAAVETRSPLSSILEYLM